MKESTFCIYIILIFLVILSDTDIPEFGEALNDEEFFLSLFTILRKQSRFKNQV